MAFVFLVLGVLSFLYANFSHKKFIELLQDKHPSLYEEMGRPTMFTRYPLATVQIIWASNKFIRYATFMANKEWLSLNNQELMQWAQKRKLFNVAFLVLLLVFMFLFNQNA